MKIERFKNFLNESYESFETKMENDFEYQKYASDELVDIFEKLDKYVIEDVDVFLDMIISNININNNTIVGNTLDKMIDLCIYGSELNLKCPEIEWKYLSNEIAKSALIGINHLVTNIISNQFNSELRTFIVDNNLVGCIIDINSIFNNFPAKNVRDIKNGTITTYLNIEDDGNNYNVYQFRCLDTIIYITKKL